MYHAIVKRIALQNFLRVNQKDYAAILKGCSSDVHHRFGGHHALGGERHDRDALGRWFERLGRLAPTLQLTVHDVWVKGGPWNTTVIMRWSAVQDLRMAHPITTTAFTSFACVGAGCSISMQTRTLNLLPHLCRYGPHME